MRCIAIDDEPIALRIIEEYCKRYGGIDLQTFTSPVKGMACVASMHPDVVFLDIEMNSHNGIEIAKGMPKDIGVIFTTAYAEYAVEGFNIDAIDFLQKPIFYPRFEQAMAKAEKYMSLIKASEQGASPAGGTITLKVEHKNVVVKCSDILYIEAMDNYVKVFRKNLPMIVSQITMKELEARLPKPQFTRLHRSYIVSMRDIEKFSNRTVYLHDCQQPIPVGRKYMDSYKSLSAAFNSTEVPLK